MTHRITTLAVTILAIASLALAGDVVTSGAAISKETPKIALAELLANPAKYSKDPVLVEGTIVASCENKGCWMQLAPSADAKDAIRVTFKDYGFFIPLDAKGKSARAEGVTVVKQHSKKDADHLIGEGAKLTRNPDGTATEVSFVANGVELW
jgi:hypothetical protein